MRNLKRALSLTLASVMLLGMMVIGTSAASYPDVTEEHNVEAIEVLQAVGVMSGSDSGNFNPDSKVSRVEMAVVMSNLLNLKVDYFENQCRFTDVPAWAGKYVAACEANGIVSGIGGDLYGTGDVTATQAALMMLKALGYFQYASDFGSNWAQETARLAANLSLFKGIEASDTTTLTRNQVAQLALNTLKTPVVVPEDNTLHITGGSGNTSIDITGGKVAYKVTASSDAFARAISAVEGSDQTTVNGIQGWVIELGEKLYNGKLQLRENGRDGATVYDDFGRPSRKWQYDGTTFGTYPKVEELRKEYTTKVTGKDLYDELGSDIVRSIESNGQWKLNVTIDGEETKTVLDGVEAGTYFSVASIKRTNTDAVGKTGNGVLTQVYVDSVHHLVDISIINTYLAIAEQDYNEKDDDVDLTVYHIDEYSTSERFVKKGDSEETIAAKGDRLDIVDVKEDDKFLVTIAQGEIQSMVAPEVVSEATINSFKQGSWVKNDDTKYDYASTAQYDAEVLDEYDAVNMKDVTYNVILDKYGYLVGLELNEGVAQYAFLTGIDLGESNLSVKNAQANLIFLDGTMKTVTVNVEKSEYAARPTLTGKTQKTYTITGGGKDLGDIANSNYITVNSNGDAEFAQVNTWCTYTVDDNGVYTLKQVGSRATARTDTGNDTYVSTYGEGVKNAKKVAQSYIDVGDYSQSKDPNKLPINNKNTSIPGTANDIADGAGANTAGVLKPGTPTGDFKYVYGNNETVYINVKLKGVTAKGNKNLAIVDKVDSVITGIANVDLTVNPITKETVDTTSPIYNAEVPTAEVYTLYNDKGYAIGVITMDATDNGTSSHFAYITKAVNQEDYTGGNTWRWHVDAIVDGQKVQLTEANDTMEYLANMKAGEWYSVTYDKDGNVNGIKAEGTFNNSNHDGTAKNAPLYFPAPTTDKFVTEVSDVRKATNGMAGFSEAFSTVLLYKDYTCATHTTAYTQAGSNDAQIGYMKVEGDTLYTSTTDSEGIRISPSTKTVLILSKVHADKRFDTITDGFTGAEGLDKALKTLKTDTVGGYTRFDGVLTAIFKDGVATSIILEDQSGNGHSAPVENVKPMTLSVTINFDDGSPAQTRTVYWHGAPETLASLIGNIPGYAPSNETLPTFVENGTGNASILYTKGTGAKITKAGSSAINAEIDGSFTAPIAADVISKSVSVETTTNANGNIVVTGTLEEAASDTKTWYGTPASNYFLPLIFEAPYGVNATKMDIARNGVTTQSNVPLTDGKELVIIGLTGTEKAVEFTVTWKNDAGATLQTSTFTVNLNSMTFAGSNAGASTLDYILNCKLTGASTSKFQLMGEATLESGKTMATIDSAAVQAVLNKYNTENETYWKVDSSYATKYINASNNTTPIEVTIVWDTVTLKAPAGTNAGELTAAWAASADKGIAGSDAAGTPGNPENITPAGISVPKGVDLTIAGTKAGKYDKNGTPIGTMNLTADKTLTADDFGYYKVTMTATSVGGTPTGLTVGAPTLADADANGAVYIKADGSVTVNIAVTATQAITAVTLTATVVDGTATAQQTLDGTAAALTLANGADGVVAVTVAGNADLTEDIIIGTITLAD